MTSHTYQFNRRDLFQVIGRTLILVTAFAVLIQLSANINLLPSPHPTLDVDRTILIHQIESARDVHPAEIVLIGDSSCLMNACARQLSEQLGTEAVNLGTLSYLDLNNFAALLENYFRTNPDRVKGVVLLQHPEALRRLGPESYHTELFQSMMRGTDFVHSSNWQQRLPHWLGIEQFQTRIFCRILPTPLPGAYGRYYGFSWDLEHYLTAHNGSALDPNSETIQGNTEYFLAPSVKENSQLFRQTIPTNVSLFVGITPVPQSLAGPEYAATNKLMLSDWSRGLKADQSLDELPITLPNENFANKTHLNEIGRRIYTERLANALRNYLQ